MRPGSKLCGSTAFSFCPNKYTSRKAPAPLYFSGPMCYSVYKGITIGGVFSDGGAEINSISRESEVNMKKTALILGSDSDLPIAEKAIAVLKKLDMPYEAHIMSAHRTPEVTARFASGAEEAGFGAIIAFAGKAAHLAGVIAAHTSLPVIGVPIKSPDLGGMDALLSTVQMPSGIPVATVAIDGGANAAWLAARILAVSEPALSARLADEKRVMEESVMKKDAALNV